MIATDKKLWKRIWWTLFTRDRAVAVALGRPPHISLPDSDVEMIYEDDFVEDDDHVPNVLHVQFFIQNVKICLIMDQVLLQNYSISARSRHNTLALVECDQALDQWLENCHEVVLWHPSNYNFWSAYLACLYNTTVCLLHRAHLPPAPSRSQSVKLLKSRAFESANAVTSIIESILYRDELRFVPPFT